VFPNVLLTLLGKGNAGANQAAVFWFVSAAMPHYFFKGCAQPVFSSRN
jgi:hypothetical protein